MLIDLEESYGNLYSALEARNPMSYRLLDRSLRLGQKHCREHELEEINKPARL